ncbi:MAG: hypothetical protein Q9P01_17715 [Anaerolineae bacterium]|nr:hypothetical protein [Anaerolineae bacterium]
MTANVTISSGTDPETFATTSVTLSAPSGQLIFVLNPALVSEGEAIDITFAVSSPLSQSATTVTASGLCAPAAGETVVASDYTPPCATDGRLEPYNCSAPIALYLSFDDDGWMLQVWKIDENGDGSFLFLIFSEDVPVAGDGNVELFSANGVSLYLLSTGEFQVNAPYHEGDKFYVLTFAIPVSEYTRGDFSVSD